MSQKRPHPTSTPTPPSSPFFKSSPISDRQSTFIAIFSPTSSGRDLQKHPDFKRADHKMLATRKASSQTTIAGAGKRIYSTSSDDDGEKYASKHLERVLTELDVEGAVVVARWYGGVLLGPVRFEHIKTVARDAIRGWKEGQRVVEEEGRGKKAKIEKEAGEKERVVRGLVSRDQSIGVLRGLLAEKTKLKVMEGKMDGGEEAKSQTSPVKKLDYAEMPLARLKQLDKARDATVAFILNQIDAAEAKEKANADTSANETEAKKPG